MVRPTAGRHLGPTGFPDNDWQDPDTCVRSPPFPPPPAGRGRAAPSASASDGP